jgi:hypothetical protein
MGQRSNQLNYVPSRGINDNSKRAVPQVFRAMLKEVWLSPKRHESCSGEGLVIVAPCSVASSLMKQKRTQIQSLWRRVSYRIWPAVWAKYDSNFPADKLDEAENLILLCKVHHKLVDDQTETYTADVRNRPASPCFAAES